MKKMSFYLSGYKKNMYNIFVYFIVCGFVGWIFETTVVLIRSGKMTERGLFFVHHNLINNFPIVWGLPVIPIYGIGGCLIVLSFGKIKKHPVVIFFIGMISMTLFELASSYLCEFFLNEEYWNYSSDILNFQGRICLRSSLAWGLLSVLAVKFLKPKLEIIYTKTRHVDNYRIYIKILMVYTFVCVCVNLFMNR